MKRSGMTRRDLALRGRMLLGLAIVLLSLTQCSQPMAERRGQAPKESRPPLEFVQRSGAGLTLSGQAFRFSGPNIYWLGLDENVGGVDYPTPFRVDNALATARAMGATVVRTHAANAVGCELCIKPTLNGVSEAALRRVDYAIAAAAANDLRLILPLIDNYEYYHGGIHTFAGWRGLPREAFYTDRQVIEDFKAYITLILTRVNSFTGVAYRDDPTILAWETGNELRPPTAWTLEIAAHIDALAPRQLVADGNIEIDSAALSSPHIDMYSLHFYPMNVDELEAGAAEVAAAEKVFFVGEYDWNNHKGGDDLGDFLGAVRGNPAIAGDLLWALFGHHDRYGYVHSNGGYKLHYPGETPEMRRRAAALREHAYAMSGREPPPQPAPDVPLFTMVGERLAWRGVVGADTYTIERSTAGPDGPWQVICEGCVTDYDTPWQVDPPSEGPAWYRVRANNLDGLPGPYSAPQTVP